MERSAWRAEAAVGLGIFLLNVLLLWPLFLPGENPYPESIEGGYVSMATFIASYPNPWGWNPLHYCGLPVQFMYLPALLYSAAAVHWFLPFVAVGHAYRLLIAIAACAGPVTMYIFARVLNKNRRWALAAALTYTLFSPLYGLAWQIASDRGMAQLPWRVQVMVKYGEGPHNAALTLLPLALLAFWRASVSSGFGSLFLAAVLSALIVLTNWVGAMGLALCCLFLLLLATLDRPDLPIRPRRILQAAGLGYLLAAFWITPSYISRTFLNWPADSFAFRLGPDQALAFGIVLAGAAALLEIYRRRWLSFYFAWVLLCCLGFFAIALGFYWYNVSLLPESRRYALEFEFFLVLAGMEALRLAVANRRPWFRYLAWAVAVLVFSSGIRQALAYVSADPERRRPVAAETLAGHKVATAIAKQQPRGRAFVSGSVRFRFNSWVSIPQAGGVFETGLSNRISLDFAYQIRTGIGSSPGREGLDAVRQLQCMAVEYVAVHDQQSKEYYRDFSNPRKFEGLLDAVYRDSGDVVYRVPFRSYASLLRPEEFPGHPPIHGFLDFIIPYINAITDPDRPTLATEWESPTQIRIQGPVPEGMAIALSVNFDEGWKAYQGGERIKIEKTSFGFMKLNPRSGESVTITVEYCGRWEQRVMAVLSVLAWAGCLVCLGRDWRRKR